MTKTIIGIDNGSSGTFAVIGPFGSIFETMPVKEQLMGRAGKLIKRIDHAALSLILGPYCDKSLHIHAYIERPFTGSAMMINTSVLSARAFEAVLIVLEQLWVGYTCIDSKEWQKGVLGQIKGSAELKRASMLRGMEMFPQHAAIIKKHKDADGLLIAHHYSKQP